LETEQNSSHKDTKYTKKVYKEQGLVFFCVSAGKILKE